MADLIERQAAIDAVVSAMIDGADAELVEGVMELLPSAQPEPSQVARDICTILENEQDMRVILKNAQPERKKGKWQITDAYPHNVYCSKCHTRFAQTHWAVWEDGSLPRNFCPSCGADMRGENE